MTRRIAGLAGLLCLLGACGDGPREAENDRPAEAVSRPPDRALLPRSAVTLRPVFQLADDGRLGLPRDLAVDEQGSVYVLDFAPPSQILKYDAEGGFVLRFGAREERQRMVSALELDLAPWKTILVIDRGRNTVDNYLTIGTFVSSVEVKPGVALDVHGLPDFGEFYLHKWDPPGRRSAVLKMRAPFDSLATTYEVRIPPDASVRQEARGVHYHTATDGHGRLYVAFYDGYPVRVLDPTGRTLRLVDLDRRPLLKSPEEIRQEEEENLNRLREQDPELDEDLLREAARPDSARPLIEELAVDPSGRLWVRTNRADASGATPYDVFNEEGEYLVRVDVPGRVQKTAFAPDGRLFAIVRRLEGGTEIRGYEVAIGEDSSSQPTSVNGT